MFGDALPFGPQSLDLRRFTFEEYAAGNPAIAERFARAQHPEIFSRDPYLQLEKFYRCVGDEVAAKEMHYLGRRDARENAKSRDGRVEWPRRTRWSDWWIKWLTGYGVRTYYLLVPILFFLLAGTLVFWSNDALIPVDPDTSATLSGVEYAGVSLTSTHANAERGIGTVLQHLFDRASYSLDLFLPLVNLHIDEDWTPRGPWRTLYALVHQIVGWVLVPLLLASLSGIIRRE